MELSIHPLAAKDARKIADTYSSISGELVTRFWHELDATLDMIESAPTQFHFDDSGLRRANLRKFPYHILFDEHLDVTRILVIRHDRRHPSYGLRRR
ncbi:type II toxin-antitoxin system RelE/ParE family toxin [Luteolibacter flavescens]|uniref:Type II toxin-antitoxin system RelE/ParE family toxin n=1 Tax=Luteolibacter flavescens TaxID=1859460 RepID=A0ABT3FTB9_9BACT|nr:type II toxin-antitoxin system RelE/ParE family toxin [Luteolibacter flavescens]MCW1886831.1 type II toxin-antitoxin system RelE/ParE family toxin [Luteolibacter flavescens]